MNENPYSAPQSQGAVPVGPPQSMSIKSLLFSFDGRINRAKFWLASIVVYLVFIVLIVAIGSVFSIDAASEPTATELATDGFGVADTEASEEVPTGIMIFIVILYIPFLYIMFAIQAKRWHDRGKSGWMILVSFIPLVGGIWAFVECGCLRGTVGPNQHGPDPLDGV